MSLCVIIIMTINVVVSNVRYNLACIFDKIVENVFFLGIHNTNYI